MEVVSGKTGLCAHAKLRISHGENVTAAVSQKVSGERIALRRFPISDFGFEIPNFRIAMMIGSGIRIAGPAVSLLPHAKPAIAPLRTIHLIGRGSCNDRIANPIASVPNRSSPPSLYATGAS